MEQFSEQVQNTEIIGYFKAIFFGFIFVMLFDHYLWDIQQGQSFFG